jgi:Holliday junction DNA helicase RuvA
VPGGDGGGGPYIEARDALAALGYRLEEAEKALNDVPPQDSVEKYIKEALRKIGSRR